MNACSLCCSGESMAPYCAVDGRNTQDAMTCALEWKAVVFCNLQKLDEIIDVKYQVCFKISYVPLTREVHLIHVVYRCIETCIIWFTNQLVFCILRFFLEIWLQTCAIYIKK